MRLVKTWEMRSRSPGMMRVVGGCASADAGESDRARGVECLEVEHRVVGEFDEVDVGDVEGAAFVEAGEGEEVFDEGGRARSFGGDAPHDFVGACGVGTPPMA